MLKGLGGGKEGGEADRLAGRRQEEQEEAEMAQAPAVTLGSSSSTNEKDISMCEDGPLGGSWGGIQPTGTGQGGFSPEGRAG